MDNRNPIDIQRWARRENFEHYRTHVPCTYSLTVQLDATRLVKAVRRTGKKTYPAHIWALASVVNNHEEFRMSVDEGIPSVYDIVHPSFTVFNPARETFASIWAGYDKEFSSFHNEVVELLETHRTATTRFPQEDVPPNVFDVSSLPWTSFSSFDLNIAGGHDHYLPIFTLGKYVEFEGQVALPVAMQVHHAVADGFHTARFLNELQEVFDSSADWLA